MLTPRQNLLETIRGGVPNLFHLPAGCPFSLRCDQYGKDCADRFPEMHSVRPGHEVRCHLTGGKEEA